MPDPVGTVRVHPDDDPRAPHARRVIRTDRDCQLPWVFLTGLESGLPGVDWRSRSDNELGIGPHPGGRPEWPRQPIPDVLAAIAADEQREPGDVRVGDVIGGRWTITSGPISVQGPNCGRPGCPSPDHPTHYHCGQCSSPDVTSMLGHPRGCPDQQSGDDRA